MKNKAIFIIQNYIDGLEKSMINNISSVFRQKSHAKSAAEELLLDILAHDETAVVNVIEGFIRRMDEYACLPHPGSYIFSIAYDTAVYLLDEIVFN